APQQLRQLVLRVGVPRRDDAALAGVQEAEHDAAREVQLAALPAVLLPRRGVELEMQVGAEAAHVERHPELLFERCPGGLRGDEQAALEILEAADVARGLDGAAEVVLERGAQAPVA